jgi:hypothetical protein
VSSRGATEREFARFRQSMPKIVLSSAATVAFDRGGEQVGVAGSDQMSTMAMRLGC